MALNGSRDSSKKCCQHHWWAHYYCSNVLPMATNGPSSSMKRCCRCPWMGPLLCWKYCQWPRFGPMILTRNVADTLEWVLNHCWKCCWYLWMGLVFLPRNVANSIWCAHCCSWTMLPMTMNQLIIAVWKRCQLLQIGWCFHQETLPMPLDGPIIFAGKHCGWQWANMRPLAAFFWRSSWPICDH